MQRFLDKEVADAIIVLKTICKSNPSSCKDCPLWNYKRCVIEDAPADWPKVTVTKTYSIEVDTDE